MEPAELTRLTTEALYLALLLSGPALVASLVVGLSIGVVQAVTQVQEQTLAFVPKLVTVGLVLALVGGALGAELARFSGALFEALPELVR
ncbi:MAG: type III secretion system export apparatus subunit SctS [Myxococcales bacterium]|nr:type III secretion system export apparatus subunit SctS [Myxococcales bacterium]MCB9628655.1 type III secretion system export apparatus subunit SctS [Sandaracinaceae bacterium]